jgi:hypothetical protein
VVEHIKNNEKTKISKKIAVTIIILLSTAILLQLFNQQMKFQPNEFDKQMDNLLFSINISLFGIVFVIMAHYEMNKYLISAFGSLFAGILPIIAFIPLILNPITNLAAFFPLYLGVTFGWFFGVNHWIIGKVDNDQKAYAIKSMKVMLGYLLYIAIGVFVLYLLGISFHNLFSVNDS